MMLGDILGGLTDAASAEGLLAAIASPEVLQQIRLALVGPNHAQATT